MSTRPPQSGKQDACIVFHHGNAWDGVPARQRYLMEAMSKYLPIVYLEDTEDRKWRVTYHSPQPNVTVVRGLIPMLLRFRSRGWKLAKHAACRWHLRWLRDRYQKVIIWDAENWLRPYRFIPHDGLIFDCIDPCFSDDPKVLADYDQREAEVVQAADVIFASAESLVERCEEHGRNAILLNNACEPGDYSAELLGKAQRPSWWPQTERPIAAYLGTLDSRFDMNVIERVCSNSPHVHFILAGMILAEHEERVAKLRRAGNVTCPGRISVEDGRYLLSRCSVGLIPFKPGAMNDAVNPVKMYAYALLGKPVVGTSVRELRERPDVALVGATAEEFSARLEEALRLSGNVAFSGRLREFALANTWAERAEKAWQNIRQMVEPCKTAVAVSSADRVVGDKEVRRLVGQDTW